MVFEEQLAKLIIKVYLSSQILFDVFFTKVIFTCSFPPIKIRDKKIRPFLIIAKIQFLFYLKAVF